MRKILCFLMSTVLWTQLGAQTMNKLGFPSTNNSFLGTGGTGQAGIGLDLYTGAAQIGLPLCNLGSKDINIPVSLNYTSGRGVKLQQYASNVGLGWQLDAGGSISRVVRGLPDEFPAGYLGTGLWGQKVADWKINNTALPNQIKGGADGLSIPTADGEPDIFYAKTPNFSFQFTFDEFGVPVFSNSKGVKIITSNFYNTTNYENASFRIVDENGTQYLFGSNAPNRERTIAPLFGTSYTFTTTWYLEKMVTFNAKDSVSFYYAASSYNETNFHYNPIRLSQDNDACFSINVNMSTTVIEAPKFVALISSPLGTINLEYEYDRLDVLNAGKLKFIQLKSYDPVNSSYKLLKTFEMHYSYFGQETNDPNIMRLKLDKITLQGNSGSTAVPVDYKVFTYNTSQASPSRTSPSFDFWGYHNSLFIPATATDGDPLVDPTLRKPNELKAQTNILISIKDMNQGSWEFEYELNSYYRASTSSNVALGGLRVKKLSQKLVSGEDIHSNYYYTNDLGQSSGQVLTNSYATLSTYVYATQVTRTLSESPSNVFDLNGNFVGYSTVKSVDQNGGYTISNFTNFSDFPDLINYTINYNPNLQSNVASSTSLAFKRGLLTSQQLYNAGGAKVQEQLNTYQALNTTVLKKSFAYNWEIFSYEFCDYAGQGGIATDYAVNVENYRLSQTVQKQYDLLNPTYYVQNITNYTYAPDKRLPRTISNSSSKDPSNYNYVQTLYYATDASIPMITSGEQLALDKMILNGYTDALVHKTITSNAQINQLHNTYQINTVNTDKVFMPNTSNYKNSDLIHQQNMVYDPVSSNMTSSYSAQDMPNSIQYGYRNCYPVAKVTNALPNHIFYHGFEEAGGFDANLVVDNARSHTGVLSGKIVQAGSGEKVSLSNNWSNITLSAPRKYTYSGWVYSTGPSVEIYLFMKTSSELGYFSYVDAAASTETNKWVFIEKEFTLPSDVTKLALRLDNNATGTVWFDDVRFYPSDAQMTTYTYDQLVGQTSETDVNNRPTYYEYDGLGRINLIRDEDKNIIKRICYNFAGQVGTCSTNPEWTDLLTTRCKPCTLNTAYNSGFVEVQQVDNNPGSMTYQQTRWVDKAGATCNNEYFQNTATSVRCKKNGSNENTGEQEQEQRNVNPCSPTYNQTRWINIGVNANACPPSVVYATIYYENTYSSGNTYYGDAVVRFFADAGCTVPISVSALGISYTTSDPCGGVPDINPGGLSADGEYLVLEYSTVLEYEYEIGQYCSRTFNLNTGTGFIIVP